MTLSLGSLHQLPILQLRGIGPGLQIRLNRLNLFSIAELLLHLPRDYQDRRTITPVAQLAAGQIAKVVARVRSLQAITSQRPGTRVLIEDDSGSMHLRFFNLKPQQLPLIPCDKPYAFFGEVRHTHQGKEMLHPEYQTEVVNDEGLVPIYALTEGLSQHKFRQFIQQALNLLDTEALHASTLRQLHQPDNWMNLEQLRSFQHPLQQELILHELASQQLALLQHRTDIKQRRSLELKADYQLHQHLLQLMGFQLTLAQERVIQEILRDLSQPSPMLRLLQGDVGSGKTAVAALIIAQSLQAGWQIALMAPTDLLAEQLYRHLKHWLNSDSTPVLYLSGRSSREQRTQVNQVLRSDSPCALVGTHALFQEEIFFSKLALIIIDEQHRFGVEQRLALRNKAPAGLEAHLLIMTATPIPRTLSMSLMGDLDTSLLDMQPPGRQPITTAVLPQERLDAILERMRHHCTEGRRAYWVCTLIEESEKIAAQAAEQRYAYLQEHVPQLRLALIHGRTAAEQRQRIMQGFAEGTIDVLVATTVIEVGVDVPEATLIIIENPERLGLSQLHQLRGRVGRGQQASYCILLYGAQLSAIARQRLAIMRQTQNGFAIAEQDLQLRGPGEVLGIRQSGLGQGLVSQLERDWPLLESARHLAEHWLTLEATARQRLVEPWARNQSKFARV